MNATVTMDIGIMDNVREPFIRIVTFVNEFFESWRPFHVVTASVSATILCTYVFNQLSHNVPITTRMKKKIFKLSRKIPAIKKKVESERDKTYTSLKESFIRPISQIREFASLPQSGLSIEEILKVSKECLEVESFKWENGKQSGTVYNGSQELTKLILNVFRHYAWANPLHPDTFPGVRKMEAEIVRMTCNLFNGGKEAVGCVSSGGTESIILAVKAYRDYAREVKGIYNPVIVVPHTAHAAFDKAAALLDIDIRHVPVDPRTKRVDIKAMKSAICRKTILLVGSAPQFPHGSMDNIPDIADLGLRYGIPVHVDACLGGFLLCFAEEAGYPPYVDFDFRVKGVTSISADTHKYGFAPKGTSVLMYSKSEYRSFQWFTVPDWPGGIYATSVIGGSRSGAVIASCWAAMIFYGKEGYVETTRKIMETTSFIAEGLRGISGIKIVGEPDVCVVAFDSEIFSIYALFDKLKERGWNLNALQFPKCIHLCVTLLQTQDGIAEEFINDVKELSAELINDPVKDESDSAALYGMAQSIPDRKVIDLISQTYLDSLYVTKSDS